MALVKGRDTAPERIVRSIVHRLGFRFRLHVRSMHGTPDIVLSRHRKVIFVHGCFWHGHKRCPRSKRPTTRKQFWNSKLDRNIERDERIRKILRRTGWKVLTVWECEIRKPEKLMKKLEGFLSGDG
jgi:DNA mismatch endonuclease (patch repair protein)